MVVILGKEWAYIDEYCHAAPHTLWKNYTLNNLFYENYVSKNNVDNGVNFVRLKIILKFGKKDFFRSSN